ncbi:PKD domain-containing protein [Kitasatospora sp. NPDC088548]|uniref:PKD domain-containing protein n=1 Tax=Kitasatospora sp. NPDC088548 TaxID=3364075 RepID=UPI00380813DA
MSIRRSVGIAAAIVSSAVAGTALPSVAQAEASVLYVDNRTSANCSDAGTGTTAQPFCTIQAAADAARPGQTVQMAPGGVYSEQVTVKRSGTPGKPITFRGARPYSPQPDVLVGSRWKAGDVKKLPYAFVISGVHDIVVTDLYLSAQQEGVLIQDSERIVLDRNTVNRSGQPDSVDGTPTFPDPAPGVRVTGKTANTTISRNRIDGNGTVAVAVDAGVTGTVVTTNQLANNQAGGVVVTDAPGTVVTGNTVVVCKGVGVALVGDSPRATVENNIVTGVNSLLDCLAKGPGTGVAVAAGSTEGTVVDYNVVFPKADFTGYSWGGTAYASATAFRATGQGTHDTSADPQLTEIAQFYVPAAAEGVTDAADANAPGQLDTDLYALPRVDHPGIANTGTGVGYHDRGAVDLHDPIWASLSATDSPSDGHPLKGTATGSVDPGWSLASATLDFGDGSAPLTSVTTKTFPAEHDYPAAGTYTVTLTATSTAGVTRTATRTLTIRPVSDLYVNFRIYQEDRMNTRLSFEGTSYSPWPIARYVVDWGDGTPAAVSYGPKLPTGLTHDYPTSKVYTVTVTVTDDHGRTSSSTQSQYVAGPRAGLPFTGYTGGPTSQVGLFYNGEWAFAYGKSTAPAGTDSLFGDPGDLPVFGSWDGSGPSRPGIYRPSSSTFALRHADRSVTSVQFGDPGDLPVVGRWDGGWADGLAIYRPGAGLFAVLHANGSVTTLRFGDPGDIPVAGDWDGVRHAQFGLFRPGRNPGDPNLFILRHDDGSVSTAAYGVKGDLPVAGDWLARGRATFGIYRPSSRTFALSNAYAGQADSVFQLL